MNQRLREAAQAGGDVLKAQRDRERAALEELLRKFKTLKRSLTNRLLVGVTDFKRFTTQALLADVDRLIGETEAALQQVAADMIQTSAELGGLAVDEPLKSAGMIVTPALPGLDADLVTATFGNTVDLLTVPMKQFGADVKTGIRRVALAGDNKFQEIQALRDKIGGAGFDNAQFRAERIIRTEIGRTFNAAQFQRMKALAADFPFLRKGWRATRDSRTRTGHREAGTIYSRGQGIPIHQPFRVKVYDERDAKAPKLIGTATLAFPLDPETTPTGKIAAGATIMCRCNAFTDFSPAELAAYNAQRVQTAVGGVPPPAPLPIPQPPAVPAPLPAPPKPKPVRIPKAPKPKPVTAVLPQPVPTSAGGTRPNGPAVSASLIIPKGNGPKGTKFNDYGGLSTKLEGAYVYARRAMALIDSIHGDGALADLPFKVTGASGHYGAYSRIPNRGGVVLELTKAGTASHPLITVCHEVGHWLDDMGLGKGPGVKPRMETGSWITHVRGKGFQRVTGTRLALQAPAPKGFTTIGQNTSSDPKNTIPELKALKDAMGASQAYQTLNNRPAGLSFKLWNYYRSPHETFARAYSQYVAVKTGNPEMLAELRELQTTAAQTGVPTQWTDADFKPIADAFDRLFAAQGWIR